MTRLGVVLAVFQTRRIFFDILKHVETCWKREFGSIMLIIENYFVTQIISNKPIIFPDAGRRQRRWQCQNTMDNEKWTMLRRTFHFKDGMLNKKAICGWKDLQIR